MSGKGFPGRRLAEVQERKTKHRSKTMNKVKKQGFTLIELMVVVIIVGILAAVAVPLMSANRDKAIAAEATGVLGTLNSQARLWAVGTGRPIGDVTIELLIDDGYVIEADLGGTYFVAGEYVDNAVWDGDNEKFEMASATDVNSVNHSIEWDTTANSYVSKRNP
jgi:prepilin-type N-terminal cleavage/methylation domain-containing protein